MICYTSCRLNEGVGGRAKPGHDASVEGEAQTA
jgi:hypothetical protein